jgi:glycosyltransferase involved in cell wall biosynthesis
MVQNPRIGMLLSRYYPYEGGAEVQCRRLSSSLQRSGCKVFVLTQRLPGLPAFETIESVPVYRVGLPLSGKAGSFSFVAAGLLWLLSNTARFDLLHAHLASSPAILGALASWITGKPSLVKFAGSRHTGDIATSSATWYGKLKLAFLKRMLAAFVGPSGEIRQEIVDTGFSEAKVSVIPNGIDTAVYRPAENDERRRLRAELGLPVDSPLITYVGRFEPGKGLETLFTAWSTVEKSSGSRSACLLLLGKGSLLKDLRKSAAGNEQIIFPGWQQDTARYLRASDIFVLPSYGEGMPNALIEAMACGLPCIASDIGGISELIRQGENGILLAPGNSSELAAAITSLLHEKSFALQLGRCARDTMTKRYSIDIICSEYLMLYERLLQGITKCAE